MRSTRFAPGGKRARALTALLRRTIDVERVVSRIALGTARPRDLAGLRETLAAAPSLRVQAAASDAALLRGLADDVAIDAQWHALLARAIAPEPAAQLRDGGVIHTGFDAELDELRAVDADCGQFLMDLERRERERTGIASLKVEYNRVHGFYIEVTHAHAERVPDDYRRRQTLKNAERYITPELKAFEDKALSAQERALAREKTLFEALLRDLAAGDCPAAAARRGARGARRAGRSRGTRADARLHPPALRRRARPGNRRRPSPGGRAPGGSVHPQRRDARAHATPAGRDRTQHGRQVDLHAPDGRHRAAGVLRHVRAGAGSGGGAAGRDLTRIGASDDLAGGRSTFMVEMTEAAYILNRATPS